MRQTSKRAKAANSLRELLRDTAIVVGVMALFIALSIVLAHFGILPTGDNAHVYAARL